MSDLKKNVEKSLKELDSLGKAVSEYGEKALAAMEKKVGQKPASDDPKALVAYYDNVLVMVRRAQGKLVESVVALAGKKSDKQPEVTTDEKWLFFHRYEQYILALKEETAANI